MRAAAARNFRKSPDLGEKYSDALDESAEAMNGVEAKATNTATPPQQGLSPAPRFTRKTPGIGIRWE